MYNIAQFFVNHFSMRFSYRFAIFLSDLHYIFSFRDRRAVKNNLKTILKSEENITVQTREVFRNFGRYLNEFFRIEKNVNKNFVEKNVKLKDIKYVDQTLEKGKGCILVTAHLGNWELGSVVLSLLGYPVYIIALPHKERPVNDLFNHQREVKGVTVVPPNYSVRRCIEALINNKVICIAGDRDFSANGEVLNFLGRKTLIPKGAALFSERTGAPIVPAFLIREEEGTFTLMFEEPIYPEEVIKQKGSEKENVLAIMKRYTIAIEDKIYQWLIHRRS